MHAQRCPGQLDPTNCRVPSSDRLKRPPFMETHVRPRFVPPPFQDATESGRLILRDGTTALVRPARPSDCDALSAFFARLSSESRHRRFFSAAQPVPQLV